ncbi:hypothetical protein [Spongiivirga citrea]|uniref:Uncharacterized protein n=1 Tax=Spongiivirga citrea TaxID=1481457 RepID=A0A6M0CLF9_9FLAO|nr:hypothetical protein [Spongiivirga citrea]NER18492.1 hypothetical protein [Spongiivirga citrea]
MKDNRNKKKNTFGVPENYFDNFQDRLFEKINGLEATPILDSIKENGDGFKIPGGYFEAVSGNILKKNEFEPKVVNLFSSRSFRYIGSIAASVLICLIGYSVFTYESGELEFEDIQAYLGNNLTDYNSYELAELLQLEADELNDLNNLNFQDETVIDYLDDQTDSYESLFDETTLNGED